MTVRALVAFAVVAAITTMSGCASASAARSADQARDSFYAVLDETQASLGGDWEYQDDPNARGCLLGPWVQGVRYPALRLGPAPADVEDAIDIVRSAWNDLGYGIEPLNVGEATELKATTTSTELIIFRVSENGMTLHGESECAPS